MGGVVSACIKSGSQARPLGLQPGEWGAIGKIAGLVGLGVFMG